jgi:hypothetical protein
MDITQWVDLYYLLAVIFGTKFVVGKVQLEIIKTYKQYVTLVVAILIGAGFVTVDYFLGVEDLSQSYKRLFLTFLFATTCYDLIVKQVFRLFEK